MATKPTFDDILGCETALFEWVNSYDFKDWERLRKISAPHLRIDYSSFLNMMWEAMPRDEFVTMASNPHVIGNPLLKTQHFVGASKWEKVSDDEVVGHHQLRVAHQKYTDETLKTVDIKGHAHGNGKIWYKKVDGEWKFAGVCPEVNWFEFDYDKIFTSGADHFDEEKKH